MTGPEMLIGIDEAGRGPVIGPLVVCGVCVDDAAQELLTEIGVRDSKAYGSGSRGVRRREHMAKAARAAAVRVVVQVADAGEVDRWRQDNPGGLNLLEQHLAERIIGQMPRAHRIIADGANLFGPLRARYPYLEAENRADHLHAVVAAASVVAKAERDRLLDRLLAPCQAEFGRIGGGGYPNATTARFLRDYVGRHKKLPMGVRRSWSWPVLRELEACCDAGLQGHPLER